MLLHLGSFSNRAANSFDVRNPVITTGEISTGFALLTDSRRKRGLQEWFLTLQRFYADRILSIDLENSQIWGELTVAAQLSGIMIPASDGLIAATALRHGLHLMIRNTRPLCCHPRPPTQSLGRLNGSRR
jgi:toxin FitB